MSQIEPHQKKICLIFLPFNVSCYAAICVYGHFRTEMQREKLLFWYKRKIISLGSCASVKANSHCSLRVELVALRRLAPLSSLDDTSIRFYASSSACATTVPKTDSTMHLLSQPLACRFPKHLRRKMGSFRGPQNGLRFRT